MPETLGVTATALDDDELLAGDHPRVVMPITVASGAGDLARGTILGRKTSNNQYAPIVPGIAIEDEILGTGDGSDKTWNGTLASPGVKPGTVVIHAEVVGGGTETFTDNGDGTLISDGATPGTGTIIYSTGVYTTTFFVAPANTKKIYGDYVGALTDYTGEVIEDSANGTQVEWSGTLAHTTVIPRSLRFVTTDTTPQIAYDDGDGEIIGAAHGSIDYETGNYKIIFSTAPASTKAITAGYCTTDGTDVARGILSHAVDATSAAQYSSMFVHGEFNRDGIIWPDDTGDDQKDAITRDLMDRGIYLKENA